MLANEHGSAKVFNLVKMASPADCQPNEDLGSVMPEEEKSIPTVDSTADSRQTSQMVDLDKEEMEQVKKFGHSFGSKLVAQGPTFFNIRTMCECFGRALSKHI